MRAGKNSKSGVALMLAGALCVTGIVQADTEGQDVYRSGSQGAFSGAPELFTGDVQVEMIFPENDVANYSAAYVTFEPGARTAWHEHPAGQHMIMISGVGLTGTRDGNVVSFKEGDAVWCPPDVDHWHGATPDQAMTHLVVTASKDGQNVIWKEKVSDEHYQPAE